MARYWLYLNGHVEGPYGVEQLIRQRGFSRQTMVCPEGAAGEPLHWISPAEIPELAHIFKAIDDRSVEAPAPAKPATPRPPRPSRPYTPAVTLKRPSRFGSTFWGWMALTTIIIGTGIFLGVRHIHQGSKAREYADVMALIERVRLFGPYPSLNDYFREKEIKPKWDIEKSPEGLYRVSISWYGPAKSGTAPSRSVYAFEVNLQAQTVRGINTAATKLLSDGFAQASKPASRETESAPKKETAATFDQTMKTYQKSVESGSFDAVWNLFSRRKRSEMAAAGISREGFMRVQGLTHRIESAVKQEVLKTKQESESERLVLLKQTQVGRPDVLIKQLWTQEDGVWKLDDEEKRTAGSDPPEPVGPIRLTPNETPAPTPSSAPAPLVPSALSLPGMSN